MAHADVTAPAAGLTTCPAFFDDYSVGMRFRSPERRIADDDVRAYVRFSNDVRPVFNPNAEGSLDVPQMYLFSLGVSMLLHGNPGYIPEHFVAFYGFDAITFHSAITGGATIRSEAVVTELTPRTSTGLVAYRHETTTTGGRVLVSSEQSILVRRRTANV